MQISAALLGKLVSLISSAIIIDSDMNNVPRAMFSWSNAATISIRHRQAPLANGHQAYMRPYSLCMTDSLCNLPLASGHQPDAASGHTVTLNGPLASAHLPLVGWFLEIKCSKYHASIGQAHIVVVFTSSSAQCLHSKYHA